jgi:SAM-dependent methyltransferase
MESKSETAAKFTNLSRGWSEKEYDDPVEFMRRRTALIRNWGAQLQPGDRILELGCGDGTLSCFLAAQGFEVVGVDISPGMIEEAKSRASREGVDVHFEVADGDGFASDKPFDAVVSFMGAFFTYIEDPAKFLSAVVPSIRKKVILDWNFRSPGSFVEAANTLERAGLCQIEWRPWFIPNATPPEWQFNLRGWVEERPNLSLLALILKRWHYTVYLKGEVPGANGHREKRPWQGNPLPASAIQRSLMRLGQRTR